ncbi:MAG: TIGR02452 family protein [Planctomycetota bacterium]
MTMANRTQRAQIANETIKILDRQSYVVDGASVSLSDSLANMRSGTVLYTPADLDLLVDSIGPTKQRETSISVWNCTTFSAARSLIDEGYDNLLCLNFASAKNPGGGFLSGSQAQEECLARASGLHDSLASQMTYYEVNRSHASSLYTNHIIYSPSVPVFRSDDDALIAVPYLVSVVTSPAVNAGAVRKNEPANVQAIQPTMEARIRSVLAVARKHDHNAIVLGAWGCGVFGNDPNDIAHWFAEALRRDSRFAGAFDRIVFGVLDFADNTPTYEAFRKVFAQQPHRTKP